MSHADVNSRVKCTRIWILSNIVGLCVYIVLARCAWSQENKSVLSQDTFDLFIRYRWVSCFTLILCGLRNIIWLWSNLFRQRMDLKLGLVWISINMLWLTAVKYDRYLIQHENPPLTKEELDEIDRETAALRRQAKEEVQRYEAEGHRPFYIDPLGGKYYHSPTPTPLPTPWGRSPTSNTTSTIR